MLNGKAYFRLPQTAMQLHKRHDGVIEVVYHETAIIRAFPDGKVMLDNGGFKTKYTKVFMNEYLPTGWQLKQIKGQWVVVAPDGTEFEYENDMALFPEAHGNERVGYKWQESIEV